MEVPGVSRYSVPVYLLDRGALGALPWSVAFEPGVLKQIDPKLVAQLQLGFTVAGEQRDYLRDLTILPCTLGR